MKLHYCLINPGFPLPDLSPFKPFKAIVLIEVEVPADWQNDVSDWLVDSGCRYMMAWGLDSSSWDNSVDHANLRQFDYGEIPDEDFIFTTWHKKDSLEHVFFHAKYTAEHPAVGLENLVIVHIAHEQREKKITEMFSAI